MSRVPLSDERTRIIFAGEAMDNYRALDAGQQRRVDRKFYRIVTAATPPTAHRYERIGNLDIIHVGDTPRIYTKMVENIPRGNSLYHLVYVFFIDFTHDYPDRAPGRYDRAARDRLDEATDIESADDLEAYLDRMDAMDASAFEAAVED